MVRSALMNSTFERVLLFRHLAICTSALLAYVLRREIDVGYTVLAVVVGSAIANFALYLMRISSRLRPIAIRSSPVVGLGAWTALIAVTNGIGSPFVAGLSLEVMLAGMLFGSTSVLFIAGAAAAALSGQQVWLGLQGQALAFGLQLSFLAATGGAVWAFQRRSEAREREFEREHTRMGAQLGRLESELEDERVLGGVGENTGRLAHGLKNSVHSLRGFVSLLDAHVGTDGQPVLEALGDAIDDLESLARLTLEENPATPSVRPMEAGPDVVLRRAVGEVRGTHPEVEWRLEVGSGLPRCGIADEDLEEVLLILLRNAIEAMPTGGLAMVRAEVEGEGLVIAVEDSGKGFAPEDLELIFRPGYTTKHQGSGYGLFLARRVLSDHDGILTGRAGTEGGAIFEVRLPLTTEVETGDRAS